MTRLLIETATLAANNEAAQKQAQSATAAAKQLLEDQDNTVSNYSPALIEYKEHF